MSIVLFHGGGAGDFSLDEVSASDHLSQCKHNVSDLLRVRGHRLALDLFSQLPWELQYASNGFNDEFSVLHAIVGLQEYELARAFSESREHKLAFRHIAETNVGQGFIYPAGVAVDAAGDVFVTDLIFQEVFKVTPSGTKLGLAVNSRCRKLEPSMAPGTSTSPIVKRRPFSR